MLQATDMSAMRASGMAPLGQHDVFINNTASSEEGREGCKSCRELELCHALHLQQAVVSSTLSATHAQPTSMPAKLSGLCSRSLQYHCAVSIMQHSALSQRCAARAVYLVDSYAPGKWASSLCMGFLLALVPS